MQIKERLRTLHGMLLSYFLGANAADKPNADSNAAGLSVVDAMRILDKFAAQFAPEGFVFATPHHPRGASTGLTLALERFVKSTEYPNERVTARMVSAREPLGETPSWAAPQYVREVLYGSYQKGFLLNIRKKMDVVTVKEDDRLLRGMMEWAFGDVQTLASVMEAAYPRLGEAVRKDVAETMLQTLSTHLLCEIVATRTSQRAASLGDAALLFRELAENLPQTVMLGPATENNRGGLHLLMLRS